jgi:hypothetical protein
MTELLKQAIAMLREMPEDVQDAVAKYLISHVDELQHQPTDTEYPAAFGSPIPLCATLTV